MGHDFEDVFGVRDLLEVFEIVHVEDNVSVFFVYSFDICSNQNLSKDAIHLSEIPPNRLINPSHTDSIAWLNLIHKIMTNHNFNASWKLSCGGPLRHFLQHDRLEVRIRTIPKFSFKGISIHIFQGVAFS